MTLHIQAISKQFGQTQVLKHIDISVETGGFLILVGPSGCGKSTLLNTIAGLELPSSGQIHLGGRDITTLPPKERDIAMVFQSYALYPTMSVADNIGFALEMRKVPKPERERRIAEVAQMLQIDHLLARKPAQLSGGQRQRVAMGRALARAPQLFLFDEPLSNLDAKLRVEMRAEIKRLHQQSGITSVYVTHDQIEAMTLGSRIAVMHQGLVQQLGSPAEVYQTPANLFVATFMGSPGMNILRGVGSQGEFECQGTVLRALGAAPQNGPLIFGVRPEHLRLDATSAWRGKIAIVEPTGADTYLLVDTKEGSLHVRVDPQTSVQVGDAVGLACSAQHCHWFDAGTEARI